ncbi:MAG: glycosyltransferase family 1 protein [Lachnospiraceae bacterium]|nr:glycosyltransferase family 1 protein [Lachnospiraceae bacterium]
MENGKIKILHFPIRNTNGGVTRSAMKFWKFIDHEKFQFDFATCTKLDFEQDIIDQGCKVHYISCYAEQNPEQFRKELREILKDGYDVIHLNTNWWKSFEAERAAEEAGVSMILVHARNTFVDVNDDEQRAREVIVHEKCKKEFSEKTATHFMACSHMAADFLFGPQIPRKKIMILHNALDISRYTYDEEKRNNLRNKLNVSDKYVIGNVGRMAYQKNHKFLIDCFYEMQKKDKDAVLLLIGDGYLEGDIRNQVMQYGIENKVIFAGAVDNVEDYLQAMDLFAFPTLFEGLPNALVEAQAAGLKCLCSDRITKEVGITDNIQFLPLDKSQWVNTLLDRRDGYQRKKVDEQIQSAGYDIRYEIKKLEEIYLGSRL